jgi:hypothetical protein
MSIVVQLRPQIAAKRQKLKHANKGDPTDDCKEWWIKKWAETAQYFDEVLSIQPALYIHSYRNPQSW